MRRRDDAIAPATRPASSFASRASRFAYTGMNDAESTPSPKRFCKKLGMRNAARNASLTPLAQTAIAQAPVPEPSPPAEKPKGQILQVRSKLIAKTQPVPVEEFLPYQEFLVGYLYEVRDVIAGEYSEKQILVMHPAYIKLEEQRLGRWKIGRTYRLQLHELENTVWKTVKSKDDSGLINLQPYIRVQDEMRHPDHAR